MRATRYLIVGGGLAADAACTGIREVDPGGRITVVSDEAHPPYARPPLSKALWTGKEESTIWRGTEQLGAELRLGRRIVALDVYCWVAKVSLRNSFVHLKRALRVIITSPSSA